jgi:hypothetical protein
VLYRNCFLRTQCSKSVMIVIIRKISSWNINRILLRWHHANSYRVVTPDSGPRDAALKTIRTETVRMSAPSTTPLTNQILINFGRRLPAAHSCNWYTDSCYILRKCGIVQVFIFGFLTMLSVSQIINTSISRRQNAGQDHNMKIANRTFENMAKFKYLQTTVTNQNSYGN